MRLTKTFVLDNEDTNQGVLSLTALQKRIQDVSDEHGTLLGFGFDDMEKRGVFWVVSRLSVQIHQIPTSTDHITIETWLNPPKASGVLRNYRLRNERNELLVTGIAKWSVVSRETLRLVKSTELDFLEEAMFESEIVLDEAFEFRRMEVSSEAVSLGTKSIRVQEQDLDFNDHVNNTIYLDYLQHTFPQSNLPTAYQIFYQRALYRNESISIEAFDSPSETVFFAKLLGHKTTNTPAFSARFCK